MNEVWKKPPISLAAYQNMVGHEVGVSSWHLVDQGRINLYADVIEDHQFIHIDPERAKKETPFGSTVAHGFLTMSLMSIMSYEVMPVIEGTTMGVNYGFDKLRFISPVRAGSRVRGRFVLAEAKHDREHRHRRMVPVLCRFFVRVCSSYYPAAWFRARADPS
jgi:acyl dehydratase